MTNEASFAKQIEHLLTLFGWHWTHFEPAVRQSGQWATPLKGAKGFPDYCAVRAGRVAFIEIKGDRGRLSKAQNDWLDLLRATENEVYVWFPDDIYQAKKVLAHD
jgi:hypothetical protein